MINNQTWDCPYTPAATVESTSGFTLFPTLLGRRPIFDRLGWTAGISSFWHASIDDVTVRRANRAADGSPALRAAMQQTASKGQAAEGMTTRDDGLNSGLDKKKLKSLHLGVVRGYMFIYYYTSHWEAYTFLLKSFQPQSFALRTNQRDAVCSQNSLCNQINGPTAFGFWLETFSTS